MKKSFILLPVMAFGIIYPAFAPPLNKADSVTIYSEKRKLTSGNNVTCAISILSILCHSELVSESRF